MPQPVAAAARADAATSFEPLRRFADAHPEVEVFPGRRSRTHQAEAGVEQIRCSFTPDI